MRQSVKPEKLIEKLSAGRGLRSATCAALLLGKLLSDVDVRHPKLQKPGRPLEEFLTMASMISTVKTAYSSSFNPRRSVDKWFFLVVAETFVYPTADMLRV